MSPWQLAGLDLAGFRRLPLFARLHIAAAPYVGWRYDLARPRVAYPSPAVPHSLVDPAAGVTNCSTLTASVLTAAYPDADWTPREYGDLQVFADRLPGYPDAPIRALERVGVGSRVDRPTASTAYLVQLWRQTGAKPGDFRGHAVIVLRYSDGRLRLLEATSREGGLGARWRDVTIDELEAEGRAAIYYGALGLG